MIFLPCAAPFSAEIARGSADPVATRTEPGLERTGRDILFWQCVFRRVFRCGQQRTGRDANYISDNSAGTEPAAEQSRKIGTELGGALPQSAKVVHVLQCCEKFLRVVLHYGPEETHRSCPGQYVVGWESSHLGRGSQLSLSVMIVRHM